MSDMSFFTVFQRHRLALLLLAFFCLWPLGRVSACAFCVHEVGFVPLHGDPYEVVIVVPEDIERDERDRLLKQARVAIGPGNVVVIVGTTHEGGRFADAAAQANRRLPAAVVYAPDGRSLVMGVGQELGDANSVVDCLSPLIDSPARIGLGEVLLTSFGKVILVEGDDEAANQAARKIAEAAIQRIDKVKAGFERVIDIGPSLHVITRKQKAAERWLLWALEIEPNSIASVAVLYGRGLRLGELLSAEHLTQEKLYTMLSYLARDCECDLQRDWLYGHSIPLRWGDELRQQAYDVLGFDPESAATRAEVARILARGPDGQGMNRGRDPFADSVTHTGFPGLTMHRLADPESVVPPAVVQAESPAQDIDTAPQRIETLAESAQSVRVSDPKTGWRTTFVIVAVMMGLVAIVSLVIVVRGRGTEPF